MRETPQVRGDRGWHATVDWDESIDSLRRWQADEMRLEDLRKT
jgi:hypothetical protein